MFTLVTKPKEDREIILRAPNYERYTDFSFDPSVLQTMPCGLFRHPADKVGEVMPIFEELVESAPIDHPDGLANYEVDIKIHMLMKGQYPCIPNWHCDHVPRGDSGEVDYSKTSPYDERMYLWLSDGPLTEFLLFDSKPQTPIKTHADIASNAQGRAALRMPSNLWVSMCTNTPHRGTPAEKSGWRVFVRLTPKSLAPKRPVYSTIRHHCQVYLDANQFSW